MNNFTIGEAWSLAVDFLNRNLQMLAILVGGAVVAFGLIQLILIGGDQQAMAQQLAAAVQSGDFSGLSQAAGGAGLGFVGLIAAIAQSATQYAAFRIGLGHGDTISEALTYGIKAAILFLLFMIGVGIVIGGIAVALVFAVGAGLFAAGGGAGAAAAVVLLILPLLLLLLWLAARLSVVTPAMADAGSINPLYGIAQSWRLTAANQWSILGYLLLLIIVAIVISAVAGIFAALFGATVGGVVSLVLIEAPLAIVSVGVAAGIYLAVAPRNAGDVFA